MMKYFGYIFIIFILVLSTSTTSHAVPDLINYQGKLTDLSGIPQEGNRQFQFYIYDSLTGGALLWSEEQGVQVTEGIFNVQLGTISSFPADLFDSTDLYLEVNIHNGGTWETIEPRQHMTSTAFSIKAGDAESLQGLTPSAFITFEDDPTVIPSVKDGITWEEIDSRPAGLDDGDNVGIETESDPTVAASVKDGVSWSEVSVKPAGFADDIDNVGITSETDPQVGNNTTNYVPKWDGSALSSGTIFDNGNVGVGITTPSEKLEVNGNVIVTGSLNASGYLRDYQLINLDPALGLGWEQYIDYGGIALGSLTGTNRQMFMFSDGANSENIFTVATSQNAGGSWEVNFVIEQDGDVGIGTTEPEAKLDINGDMQISTTDGPSIVINDSDGNGLFPPGIQFNNSNTLSFSGDDTSSKYFNFSSGNSPVFRDYNAHLRVHGPLDQFLPLGNYIGLTSNGVDGEIYTNKGDIILSPAENVGIGTSAPVDKLEIEGGFFSIDGAGGANVIRFKQNDTIMWSLLSAPWINNDLRIRDESPTTSTDIMAFEKGTGNIGIGTTTPETKLDVNGDTRIRGGLKVDGQIQTYYSVPVAQFHSAGGGTYNEWADSMSNTASFLALNFTAAINLPHGAIVNLLSCWWHDDSPLNGILTMERYNLYSGETNQIAYLESRWDNDERELNYTHEISYAQIDNYDYAYRFKLYLPYDDFDNDAGLRFGGARIRYTYSPAPESVPDD